MNQLTTYECTIHAVTMLGGPASNPVTVTTHSGMYVHINSLPLHMNSDGNIMK